VAIPPEVYHVSVNIAKLYTTFPACSNFSQHFFLLTHNTTTRLHMLHRQLFLSQTRTRSYTHQPVDKQWPWYEPNRKMNQIQNRWISGFEKMKLPPYTVGTCTGRMGLASRSQECNSWLQGVGKLQDGYSHCSALGLNAFHVRERRLKLIQKELSSSKYIFWDCDTSLPPVFSRALRVLQVERMLI